jgi:hypothetical protein
MRPAVSVPLNLYNFEEAEHKENKIRLMPFANCLLWSKTVVLSKKNKKKAVILSSTRMNLRPFCLGNLTDEQQCVATCRRVDPYVECGARTRTDDSL